MSKDPHATSNCAVRCAYTASSEKNVKLYMCFKAENKPEEYLPNNCIRP